MNRYSFVSLVAFMNSVALLIGLVLGWEAGSGPELIDDRRAAEVRLETTQTELTLCLEQNLILTDLSEAHANASADAIASARDAIHQQVVLMEMLGLDAVTY